MSVLTNSAETQIDDLRMVFFETREDDRKAIILIRDGKVPKFMPYGITSLKAISLFGKEGVKFKEIKKPINISDLTPEQREDVKNKKAKLIKIEELDLLFFFEAKN